MDTQALWLTLRLALSTTALLMLIALPLARWIAGGTGGRARCRAGGGGAAAGASAYGAGVLSAGGAGAADGAGADDYSSDWASAGIFISGLVVGSVLYSLPFAVQPLVAGFRAVDPALLEVAATLGASPLRAFRTITLPLAKPSLVTAAVLTFTHTVGEFGVVLMLGGNIPGATRTLSIALYDQVQDFNYAAANQTAAVLLAFSLVTLIVVYWRGAERRSLLG